MSKQTDPNPRKPVSYYAGSVISARDFIEARLNKPDLTYNGFEVVAVGEEAVTRFLKDGEGVLDTGRIVVYDWRDGAVIAEEQVWWENDPSNPGWSVNFQTSAPRPRDEVAAVLEGEPSDPVKAGGRVYGDRSALARVLASNGPELGVGLRPAPTWLYVDGRPHPLAR